MTDAEKVVKALRAIADPRAEAVVGVDVVAALADFVEAAFDVRHGGDYATAEWWDAARQRYDVALARLREVLGE